MTTPWDLPAETAARPRARIVSSSLLRLWSAHVTTSSAMLGWGLRRRRAGARTPASFSLLMFSTLLSARMAAPPASIASATLGSPQAALVTAATSMPVLAQMAATVLVFCSTFARSISIRGSSKLDLPPALVVHAVVLDVEAHLLIELYRLLVVPLHVE